MLSPVLDISHKFRAENGVCLLLNFVMFLVNSVAMGCAMAYGRTKVWNKRCRVANSVWQSVWLAIGMWDFANRIRLQHFDIRVYRKKFWYRYAKKFWKSIWQSSDIDMQKSFENLFDNQGCWQCECKDLASVTGIGDPQLQIPLTAISLHPEHANMCQ